MLFVKKITALLVLALVSTSSIAKTGLVLSGGGAKGFAHIGILKEIDKRNIKIDYIAGTSMGCIIGALYALGYSAKDLERICMDQDWADTFNDKPIRKYVPMYEKDESERYVGSFSISKGKSFLPTGIISGQKIYMRLAELTWNYQDVSDFNKLPIPVWCVATDLENGDAVMLNRGSIAEAMRASMSIPSIFDPVNIDGRVLVDGGIVNNLPVSVVKKMGADTVIASDVSGGLYKKEELGSFFDVIEQVVMLNNYKNREQERKQANILFKIDTSGYSLASFDDVNELISRGEKSTQPYLKELDKLPKNEKVQKEDTLKNKDFRITSIKVEGLKKVSLNFVLNHLKIETPSIINKEDMETAIQRLYGTQFFETVHYYIKDIGKDDNELIVKIKERSTSLLRFGFNYSKYTKASLLINTTFKNTLGKDSKISLDFKLSENPGFRAQYYSYSQKKPGLGLKTELLFNSFNITTFQNGIAEALYRFHYYALDLSLETSFSNYILWGAGVDKEFTTRDPSVQRSTKPKEYDEFLTFKSYLQIDTLDSATYPKRGLRLNGTFKLVTDALSLQDGISHKTFEQISFNSKFAIPVTNRLSLITDASIGSNIGQDIPYEYLFYYGGFRSSDRWFLPFVGLDYMTASGENALVIGESMQIEFIKNFYFIFTANIGKLSDEFKDVFNSKNHLFGLGATLGWDSLIGPIELSIMKELNRRTLVASVSLGYWF